MSLKKIAVVTGGAGFIGSHLVDLCLEMGFRVRVLDDLSSGRLANLNQHNANPDLVIEEGDIRNLDTRGSLFEDAHFVFHFAGIGDLVPSMERPLDYLAVNAQGTARVLEAARQSKTLAKFVYAASSSCYGLASTPTREDHPIKPEHPYGLSKYLGEVSCFHWHRVFGLPVNSVRIFNAYGTRSRTSGAYGAVFGVFLRQKLANAPLTIVGDGTQSRDFLYVTDVARAFFAAANTQMTGEIWNLGAGNPQAVNYLASLIGGPQVHIPKRPGEPDCTFADITKIHHDLDWTPKVCFEAGVAEVMANIEYWREAPLWDPASIETATAPWFQYLAKS